VKARIVDLDYCRGMYAFEREDGEYGYFELLGAPDLEIDDVLKGNFTDLGGTTVTRMETMERVDICIEDFCSLEIAKEQIH